MALLGFHLGLKETQSFEATDHGIYMSSTNVFDRQSKGKVRVQARRRSGRADSERFGLGSADAEGGSIG